jgi:predicted ATPase
LKSLINMDKHLNYTEVRWKNFKGFKDTGWIKIKPVTIILGSNNSGKTNFLAPFLLMNQTVNSRDRLSPLILIGDLYDAGNYQEIVKDYITENEIYFGFKYHIHETTDPLEEIGTYPPGAFDVTFNVENKESEIRLKSITVYDLYGQKFFSMSRNKTGTYKYSGIGNNKMTKPEKNSILRSQPINFLFSPNTVLSDLKTKTPNKKEVVKGKVGRFSEGYSEFLSAISFNNSSVRDFLGDLSFLGPIRENPHRIYEITNETYNTVGSRGEKMPNLLKKIGNNNKALNDWVKRFGFGDKVHLEKLYSNAYSLRFKNNNSTNYTSISNAGFGASQILPLIVQAVVSPPGSITIAEQPEIHLNPKVQCELADLFIAMANKHQTVIVETHSEHLLLRLRRLVAENKIRSEDVAIYFVENDRGNSQIKSIALQENGNIKPIDWPKDFFAESLKEALAMASEQAKRKAND